MTAYEPQRDRFLPAAGTEWRVEARNRRARSPRAKESWRASSIQTPIHCAAVAERCGNDHRTMKPLPVGAMIPWWPDGNGGPVVRRQCRPGCLAELKERRDSAPVVAWRLGVCPKPAQRPVEAQGERPARQGGFLRERLLGVPGSISSEDLSKPGLVTSLPPELFRLAPVCPSDGFPSLARRDAADRGSRWARAPAEGLGSFQPVEGLPVSIPGAAAGEPAFRPAPQSARWERLLLWDDDLSSIGRRQATLRQAARNLRCSFQPRQESAEKRQPVRDEGAAC